MSSRRGLLTRFTLDLDITILSYTLLDFLLCSSGFHALSSPSPWHRLPVSLFVSGLFTPAIARVDHAIRTRQHCCLCKTINTAARTSHKTIHQHPSLSISQYLYPFPHTYFSCEIMSGVKQWCFSNCWWWWWARVRGSFHPF